MNIFSGIFRCRRILRFASESRGPVALRQVPGTDTSRFFHTYAHAPIGVQIRHESLRGLVISSGADPGSFTLQALIEAPVEAEAFSAAALPLKRAL